MSIRADEACHRETNHFFADIDADFDIAEEKTIVYNESPVDANEAKKVDGKSQPGENMKMDWFLFVFIFFYSLNSVIFINLAEKSMYF